jgi:hypothetical protein
MPANMFGILFLVLFNLAFICNSVHLSDFFSSLCYFSAQDLEKPVVEWRCGGVPITMMCGMEKRKGKMKPVIQKVFLIFLFPAFGEFSF